MPLVIIQIIQALAPAMMQYGPQFVEDIIAIFRNPSPTPQDWEDLKTKYAQPDPPQA